MHGQPPRVPDDGGVAFWTDLLRQGVPIDAVLQGMVQSPEGVTTSIQQTYALLGRLPGPVELENVRQYLAAGGQHLQLRSIVIGSPEYFVARGRGSDLGFLQAAGSDLLGRPFSALETAVLRQVLRQGMSRSVLARLILQSPEAGDRALRQAAPETLVSVSQASMADLAYEQFGSGGGLSNLLSKRFREFVDRIEFRLPWTGNERFVARLYIDVLGRYLDNGGYDYWVGRLEGTDGMAPISREQVAQNFCNGDEFHSLALDRLFQKFLQRLPSATYPPRGGRP